MGARQLGASVALVGVVGADEQGAAALRQAAADGIDVSGVVRREGTDTALLVDLVTADGKRRLLEDVPPGSLLRLEDVRAAGEALRSARMVLLQLQQPGEAVLEAARLARAAGVTVVVDGAVEDPEVRRAVLAAASVVRADATEAAMLLGEELDDLAGVVRAAQDLVAQGVPVVALAAGSEGTWWPGRRGTSSCRCWTRPCWARTAGAPRTRAPGRGSRPERVTRSSPGSPRRCSPVPIPPPPRGGRRRRRSPRSGSVADRRSRSTRSSSLLTAPGRRAGPSGPSALSAVLCRP